MTGGSGSAPRRGRPGGVDWRGVDWRAVAATVAGLAVVVVAVAPFLLWWHRLPSPMAVHWNASGRPDGAVPRGAAAALSIIPAALCGLAAATLCLPTAAGFRSPASGTATKLASILAGIGTLLAVTGWATVAANADAASWHAASRLRLSAIALGVLLGIAVLLAMAWLTQARPPAAAVTPRPAAARPGPASEPPAPGQRAAWAGRARLTWWVPVVLIVAATVNVVLALYRGFTLVLVIPLALLLLVYLALGWIRVTVDRRGLRIHYGLLPWPVTVFPLALIRQADRIGLKPMQWGGWGYRGSRRALRRSAVVLRGGDAIRLLLTDGTEFAVTVDDAAAGAGLLADLLAGAPAGG